MHKVSPVLEANLILIKALSHVETEWSSWGSWSSCSVTCGSGVNTRSRACNKADPDDADCDGESTQKSDCTLDPCPLTGNAFFFKLIDIRWRILFLTNKQKVFTWLCVIYSFESCLYLVKIVSLTDMYIHVRLLQVMVTVKLRGM